MSAPAAQSPSFEPVFEDSGRSSADRRGSGHVLAGGTYLGRAVAPLSLWALVTCGGGSDAQEDRRLL